MKFRISRKKNMRKVGDVCAAFHKELFGEQGDFFDFGQSEGCFNLLCDFTINL